LSPDRAKKWLLVAAPVLRPVCDDSLPATSLPNKGGTSASIVVS